MRLRLLRLFVIAIALVVPLQGMTAVMAGQCMALGHHDGHGAAHDHDSHDHEAHSHNDESGDKGSHCGPCTACCASASIAAHAAFGGPAERFTAPYVISPLPPPGIQLDGLDRPPLSL